MIQEQRLLYLNPRDLQPSLRNVRSDPGDLAGLAETIREHGVLQPLGVTREQDGYRIVYGNRRRDAAIVVGLDRVPCVEIGRVDDGEVLIQQVLENLQRLDLNDLDKARAFQTILDRLTTGGASHGEALDALARTLGLSVRQIQRYLRLNMLDEGVQQMIASGDLGVTHAQHLAALDSAPRQAAVAHLAVAEGLSAAELSRLCSALALNPNIAPEAALAALRRGDRVPLVQEASHSEPTYRGSAGRDARDSADDSAWAEDEEPGDAKETETGHLEEGVAALEPATRDGNRVRRLHSLDSFMDEVQRLTRCVQDGDLQRFLEEDEASSVKARLAARQLRFLCDAVTALAEATGARDVAFSGGS